MPPSVTNPVSRTPGHTGRSGDSRLVITVLFTNHEATVVALKRAASFSQGMGALIRLLLIEVVPYPLSFREPPRSDHFAWYLLERTAVAAGIEAGIEIYLCRDQKRALKRILAPPGVLVMGGRQRFWSSREQRLARWLKRQGHSIIFVPVQ